MIQTANHQEKNQKHNHSANETTLSLAIIENNPDFIEARRFLQESKSADQVESYDLAFEYGKNLYETLMKTRDKLDDKANDIIKYLGGGIGLFTFGVLAKVDSSNYLAALFSLVPISVAVFSVFNDALVRRPSFGSFPIPVRDFCKDYLETYKNTKDTKAAFLGQWDYLCTMASLSIDQKSKLLKRATDLYVASLMLLPLPVIAAILVTIASS